jgi:hypothetical protein
MLERGNLNFLGADVRVNPNGSPGFSPELSEEQGYYFQLKYFVVSLLWKEQLDVATPESTLRSIDIIGVVEIGCSGDVG